MTPWRVGIVGAEAAKFTQATEKLAKYLIRDILTQADLSAGGPITVVSGGCHLGGIDIWAADEAPNFFADLEEYKPAKLRWDGGYKQRNLKIVERSDEMHCITVLDFPPGYEGMRFPTCYHCVRNFSEAAPHVKSGGCWTLHQFMRKNYGRGYLHVVHDDHVVTQDLRRRSVEVREPAPEFVSGWRPR